ncbi:serine/threonine-protein kinase [Nocardia sp. NPDC056100]|uniref:serine/threonine-protein kinase n=1 Tax=Nocardia sp. NPDC056100 TaxID=3345712 RepID=UPI0035E32997
MDGGTFGPYQLRRLLGEGGMGQVFEAWDTGTERAVALKVLPRLLSGDTTYRARFRREANIVAGLSDPHVVPIHTFGEIDGQLFLDMRLVVGRTLQELLLTDGALAPRRSVTIVEQVASALDDAHAHGIIHRDVKPSNILIGTRDFVYLIDFGIAHSLEATQLTTTGKAIGTFAYMAPERFSGGPIGAHTDVYALACVLYECLTGSGPFSHGSIEQQIAAHLTLTPVPASELTARLPPDMDEVLNRGLAKAPEERYGTAGELVAAAHTALAEMATPSAAIEPQRPHRVDTEVQPAPSANATPTPRSTHRDASDPTDIDSTLGDALDRTVIGLAATEINPATPETPGDNEAGERPTSARGSQLTASRRRLYTLAALATAGLLIAGVTAWQFRPSDSRHDAPTMAAPAFDVSAINTGREPYGLAVDPTAKRLYATHLSNNSVSVIDTSTASVVTTMGPFGCQGIALDSNAHLLYLSDFNERTIRVIDPVQKTAVGSMSAPDGPNFIALNAAAKSLYAPMINSAKLAVFDTGTLDAAASITLDQRAQLVAVDETSQFAWAVTNSSTSGAALVWIDAGRKVVGTKPLDHKPVSIALARPQSTAGDNLYLVNADDNSVSVISTDISKSANRIPVGAKPSGITVDDGIHTAYVANHDGRSVTAIDTSRGSVTATIPLNDVIDQITVDPLTHTVYGAGSNGVVVIKPR